MKTQTLLIADSNGDFRSALREVLQNRYTIRCCETGKEALSILRSEHCDILILDLMLPELDGISLLQAAAREGISPMTLALSPFLNGYVLEMAVRLGVNYLIRKPCDVRAIAARTVDLSEGPRQQPDRRAYVSALLIHFGICVKHDGYSYLLEAIVRMADNPLQGVTKELYPAVAAACGSSGKLVERSIRSALDAAWKHREDYPLWRHYFPPSANRPTNSVFITRLAESLRLNQCGISESLLETCFPPESAGGE